mmetsp:Transcript_24539/g.67413  ORF Transcript_24539/g.67413 Transcript_24539/m.67413 type:complete len:204 (-) Transcript_24539:10-621(-)
MTAGLEGSSMRFALRNVRRGMTMSGSKSRWYAPSWSRGSEESQRPLKQLASMEPSTAQRVPRCTETVFSPPMLSFSTSPADESAAIRRFSSSSSSRAARASSSARFAACSWASRSACCAFSLAFIESSSACCLAKSSQRDASICSTVAETMVCSASWRGRRSNGSTVVSMAKEMSPATCSGTRAALAMALWAAQGVKVVGCAA